MEHQEIKKIDTICGDDGYLYTRYGSHYVLLTDGLPKLEKNDDVEKARRMKFNNQYFSNSNSNKKMTF